MMRPDFWSDLSRVLYVVEPLIPDGPTKDAWQRLCDDHERLATPEEDAQEDDDKAWIEDEEANHDCLEDRLAAAFERADNDPLDDTKREYWARQL